MRFSQLTTTMEKKSEKDSHTSYLRAATMPRKVYWRSVLTVLATGGELTNNWFVGEGGRL